MDKAEAEMREILAGSFANAGSDAFHNNQTGELLISDRVALRAMAAYGDLRARQAQDIMRERCAKVADEAARAGLNLGEELTAEGIASAIRSLKPD